MRKKSKKLIVICAVLIALIASTTAAYAYFTDYEQALGGAQIKLEGQTEIHEEADDAQKTLYIKNTGETDVIVRVAAFGDFIDWDNSTWEEGDWMREGDWFYYKRILKPGEATSEPEEPNLVIKIDTEAAKKAEHDFDIVVVHESQRVSYDGTAENKVVKPDKWPDSWYDLGIAAESEGGE